MKSTKLFETQESTSDKKKLSTALGQLAIFGGILAGVRIAPLARVCVRVRAMAGAAAQLQQQNPGSGFSGLFMNRNVPNYFRRGNSAFDSFTGEKLLEQFQEKQRRVNEYKEKSERKPSRESFDKENSWITRAFGAADQAVKENRLLPIFPLGEYDVSEMNSYMDMDDQHIAGAMLNNPVHISPYNLWFIKNAEGQPYQYYMYIADMTALTITHESAHFLLDSKKLTKEELQEFAKKMIQAVQDDLKNLQQKTGDEVFENNKMIILDTLQLLGYSLVDEMDRAHEYFAHIVEFSHSNGIGFENIQAMLPKSADFITKLYQELDVRKHIQHEARIEVVEDDVLQSQQSKKK